LALGLVRPIRESPSTSPPEKASFVLGLLIDAYPVQLSRSEIANEIGDKIGAADALRCLVRIGLAHKLKRFYWATRAALAADELAV
jgi:hypothetical protein